MKSKADERTKMIALSLSICLVFVILVFRMMSMMHDNQNNPGSAQHDSVVRRSEAGPSVDRTAAALKDPFWRPYSEDLVKTTAKLAAAPSKQNTPSRPVPSSGKPAGPAAVDDLELEGVVTDSSSIAIIRVGSEVRYLRAGAEIDAITRLKSIKPGRVTILEAGRDRDVLLGQILIRGAIKSALKDSPAATDQEPSLPGFAPTP